MLVGFRFRLRPLKHGELVWATWAATFVVFEVNGIVNETPGDTLSEQTRRAFNTKTRMGKIGFVTSIVALVGWFIPHILEHDE